MEIVNLSRNLLFCGMTNNFNLTELMEKRVRSRFSQKTMFITIKNLDGILLTLQNMFIDNLNKNSSMLPKDNKEDYIQILNDFYSVLLRNELFVQMIISQINKGFSVKQILTKIKLVLANFLFELNRYNEEKVNFKTVQELINKDLNLMKEEEFNGSYSLLLRSKYY